MARTYGTGQLYRHPEDAKLKPGQRQAWYGRWYVGSGSARARRNRKVGWCDDLTPRQAERALREMIVKADPPPPAPGERLTIREVGVRLIADLERKGRKPETIRNVRVAVERHAAPFFGDRPVDTLTGEDFERLQLHMGRQGARSRDRGLAPKSIRNYLGALSSLYTFAIKKRYAITNPVSLVDLPQKADSDEIRFLTLDEVFTLVDAVEDGPYAQVDRTLFLVAAMTGLRLGELRALRWRDVDWRASKVRVRRNYVRGAFQTPKSRKGTRAVPMADEVAGALDRHHQATRPARDGALVFPDPLTGDPLDDNGIRDRFATTLTAAMLPKHTPHDLRHTFGTAMAAEGVPMRTLMAWMGHASITTTMIYSHYAPSHEEAAIVSRAFQRDRSASVHSSVQPDVNRGSPTSTVAR